MSDHLTEVSVVLLIAGCAFILGIVAGITGNDASMQKNCDLTNVHRIGEKVYDCKPRGK